jgi:hypothetical protein
MNSQIRDTRERTNSRVFRAFTQRRNEMKHIFWSVMTVALVATQANANPSFSACTTQSLLAYETQGGCTIGGNFLFTAFTYTTVDAFSNPVLASDITVTPSTGASDPTLAFSANWNASGLLSLAEGIITFAEFSQTPGIGVSAIDLTDTGNVVPGLLGALGTAAVAEVDCFGGLLNVGTGGVACLTGGPAASANATLPTGLGVNASALLALGNTVSEVDVIKTITLSSVAGGSSSITGIGQDFTSGAQTTPEPGNLILIGTGLLGLGAMRRKRTVACSSRANALEKTGGPAKN